MNYSADYNKYTKNIVHNNIKIKNLVGKSAIARFINNADLHKKSRHMSNKSWIKSKTKQNNKITSIWFMLFSR